MATAPVVDGFTKDVLVLMREGRFKDKLRETALQVPPENRPAFLQEGLIHILAPYMASMPSFLQSIVARAIMENVDWGVVAERVSTVPENN